MRQAIKQFFRSGKGVGGGGGVYFSLMKRPSIFSKYCVHLTVPSFLVFLLGLCCKVILLTLPECYCILNIINQVTVCTGWIPISSSVADCASVRIVSVCNHYWADLSLVLSPQNNKLEFPISCKISCTLMSFCSLCVSFYLESIHISVIELHDFLCLSSLKATRSISNDSRITDCQAEYALSLFTFYYFMHCLKVENTQLFEYFPIFCSSGGFKLLQSLELLLASFKQVILASGKMQFSELCVWMEQHDIFKLKYLSPLTSVLLNKLELETSATCVLCQMQFHCPFNEL